MLALKGSIFINCLLFWLVSGYDISCRDENNKNVDWFYLYKLPLHFDVTANSEDDGLQYMFMTSEIKQWQKSKKLINELNSFPGQTIAPELMSNSSILIAYNDETPIKVDFENGHTKGLLAADEHSGYWLIHSVPKFPNSFKSYDYPKNGLHYGQSFLCITLPSREINKIAEQLLFNEPNVYEGRVPIHLKGIYSNIDDVLNQKWKKKGPFSNVAEFNSLNGTRFVSFAKGRNFHKELYEDWVAPQLNVNLLVESWRLGPGNLATNCSKMNKVYNIKGISKKEFDISFHTTSDHSKWAVSSDEKWICVGDINRQEHQLMRGGGTVCLQNSLIAPEYKKLICNFERCNEHK